MTIAVRNAGWWAGNKRILDGIDLNVEAGETLGLLGPNGSGKSTLLRLMCGLRLPRQGTVCLGGKDMASMPRHEIARRLAFVEQQATTESDVTVLDVVRLGRTPHRGPFSVWSSADEAAVSAALDHVGMTAKSGQAWRTLSGGEQQRVQIARALAQTPSELMLDEPTNHLDIQHQLELLALVRDLPVTAVVALHDINLAAMFCDRVAVLRDGRLVACGRPESVLSESLLWEVFGVRARVATSPDHGRHMVYLMPPGQAFGVEAEDRAGFGMAVSTRACAGRAVWR